MPNPEAPFDALATLLKGGEGELVLCAPFIKLGAFSRVMNLVPVGTKITVFTRWDPGEILAGVSDPEIWNILQERVNAELYLCPSLHAKYFRIGEDCLIGSSNLTQKGLGIAASSNLEILTKPGPTFEFDKFEERLFGLSKRASKEIFDSLQGLLDLREAPNGESLQESGHWLPRLQNPSYLFQIYSGGHPPLSKPSIGIASSEMRRFAIPAGLSESEFRSAVGIRLLEEPFIWDLAALCKDGRRFGEIRSWLREYGPMQKSDLQIDKVAQAGIRWVAHFLPWAIKVETPGDYSEVVRISLP
jgi:hypothetical protein